MTGVIGGLSRSLTWGQVVQLNVWSWFGNLAGSLALAWLVIQSGILSKGPQADLIGNVAAMKMSLPAWELFLRGLLCNWLVCLAVWTSGRTTNDAAKIMLTSGACSPSSAPGSSIASPINRSSAWRCFW